MCGGVGKGTSGTWDWKGRLRLARWEWCSSNLFWTANTLVLVTIASPIRHGPWQCASLLLIPMLVSCILLFIILSSPHLVFQSLHSFFSIVASRMRALAHSHAQETTTCSSLKCFKASIRIVIGGMDIDITLLLILWKFIEEECMEGLCFVEHSGAWTHKHFRMVVKGNFGSFPMLNKKSKLCVGWDEWPPTGHVVSCKSLKDEGLHAFLVLWLGIVWKILGRSTLSLCNTMF